MKNYVILDSFDNSFVKSDKMELVPVDNGKFLSATYTQNVTKAFKFSKKEAKQMKKSIIKEIEATFKDYKAKKQILILKLVD